MPSGTLLAGQPPAAALRLRDYQRQAIDTIAAARDRGITRQLVVLPTGSGKTVIFAHMAAANPGRTLILVHRDELVRQTAQKLLTVDPGLDLGIVKAGRNEHDRQVVIASVQSLSRPARLAALTADHTLIIVMTLRSVQKNRPPLQESAYHPENQVSPQVNPHMSWYADLRTSGRSGTHCVPLRTTLRTTHKDHLTCIDIDHLEGWYAGTQIRGCRLRGNLRGSQAAPRKARAGHDPSLSSMPENLSEDEDPQAPHQPNRVPA